MTPSDSRIFVREDEAPKEKGGIILVDKLTKEITGTVVKKGPDVQFLKVGDRVQCARKETKKIEVDGEELWCMLENPDRILLLG